MAFDVGMASIIVAFLFFWFCLAVVIPLGWIKSFFYSLILHIVTSTWIAILFGFLLLYVCHGTATDLERYAMVYTDLSKITLSFALVYNSFLYVTALLLHGLIPLPRFRLAVALFMSGITSALLVTRFIIFG